MYIPVEGLFAEGRFRVNPTQLPVGTSYVNNNNNNIIDFGKKNSIIIDSFT